MKLGGFTLLRICGIEVVIDYSWFVIFFLMMYVMAEEYFPLKHQAHTVAQYWIMGGISSVLIFVSVLVHELAHSLVAVKHGVKVTSIRLLFFGGLAQVASEPKSGRHEFLIALAGPATSIALGVSFLAVYSYLAIAGLETPASGILEVLAFANIMLALFNLIPGLPLDGGRILRAILWDCWGDMARATKIVSQFGNAFALFLIILGFLQFFVTRSLISGLWLIIIGFFMKQAALGSYQAVVLRQSLAGVQVKQIMTEKVVSVDWLVSIDELVRDYIYRHQFTNFPVFNRDEFVGMVSLEGVKTVAKDLWGFKQVRDIMTPVELVPCLNPNDDATEALSRMVSADIGRMPVVENGKLLGIVSRRDIMNLFKIKSDLGLA
jgi:Zn-dependent protease/predicted transcriptional regulator